MSGDVDIDLSEVLALVKVLDGASRAVKESGPALDAAATLVRAQAAAIASTYTGGTGALAGDVIIVGRGKTFRKIGSSKREGHFLEFGSPKTGAPRPWLTGPAEQGVKLLATAIGEIGAPW